jgi:hypothetical protein
MKKVICATGFGPYTDLLVLMEPTMGMYAERHGYDVHVCDRNMGAPDRPPSWSQLPMMMQLCDEYDLIVLVGSDTSIVSADYDIADALPAGYPIGIVAHQYDGRYVPNADVMVIRVCDESRALLKEMWDADQYINHPWWQNAALLEMTGFDPAFAVGGTRWELPTTGKRDRFWFLDRAFNSIRQDPAIRPTIKHYAGEPFDVRFFNMAGDLWLSTATIDPARFRTLTTLNRSTSVVVVLSAPPEDAILSLSSIAEAVGDSSAEVVIVDRSSGLGEGLLQIEGNITVCPVSKWCPTAEAMNMGLQMATGDVVVMLQGHAVLDRHALTSLVAHVADHRLAYAIDPTTPSTGAPASKAIAADRESLLAAGGVPIRSTSGCELIALMLECATTQGMHATVVPWSFVMEASRYIALYETNEFDGRLFPGALKRVVAPVSETILSLA